MRVFYKSLLSLLGFFSVQMQAKSEVNVAEWGTADQSSIYKNNKQWQANKALDGSKYTCACTKTEDDPWWKVDLKTVYSVDRVTITNIQNNKYVNAINGAKIRIGNNSDVSSNPECAQVTSIPAGETYSYSCGGKKGRFVSVNIDGNGRTLAFCDLAVYVSIFPGNLATGKTVTQSSTYENWLAQQAIDLNPGFTNPSSECSLTETQKNPWWRVDLGNIYKVSRVVITNRQDCCPERINGAEIHIGNSLENNGNNNPRCAVIPSIPAGVNSTFTCNDMQGQYVNIYLPGDSTRLSLCEVEVYGEDYSCEDEF